MTHFMAFSCLLAVTDVTRSLWKFGFSPTVDARQTGSRIMFGKI
jgi:hypothetical protein